MSAWCELNMTCLPVSVNANMLVSVGVSEQNRVLFCVSKCGMQTVRHSRHCFVAVNMGMSVSVFLVLVTVDLLVCVCFVGVNMQTCLPESCE